MDDLIKGLVDVTIGHNNPRNDDNNNESVDQRSRSTWAQVVSGEQDDDQRVHTSYSNSHANPTGDMYGRNEAYGSAVESRPHQMGSYQVNEDREKHNNKWEKKEEQEENTDGWEVAHKKHNRRPQKVHMDHWNSYKCPASEQHYSEDVNYGAAMEPCREELADYKRACAKLWELDFNRLTPGKDYEIDVGEGKRVCDRQDMAGASLFTWVSEEVLRKPTFSRFCALLDNYNPQQGCKENVTAEERQEQAAFIEEISRTAPLKYLHKYLSINRLFSDNYQEFKRMLTD